MNILWFSLSPCGSMRRNNKTRVTQGWMISLEDEIKKLPNIKLSVSYISSKDEKPFEYDGVNYFPVCRKISQNGVKRVLARCKSHKKQDEEILPQLLNVVRTVKPDLIHIHGTEECFGLIQDFIKDIPIVFSIQGLIAPYKEKFFAGIPQNYAYKYDSLYDRIRHVGIKHDYETYCYGAERENHYLSHAKYIFGRTFWDRNCTLALNPQRKYFVVNEILRPEFYTKKWKGFISQNNLNIISTISGGLYKGIETVLKAAYLLKKYSDINFIWNIVGYTKDEKFLHIAEDYSKIKACDCNIKFHGRLKAQSLSDILCSSDIYVQVSHIENSPNSVCEAMMLGMPIIASFAGGTASLLSHGEDGILYQDGDAYILSGSIMDLVHNHDLALKYSCTARQHAILRHDKTTIANSLLDNYIKIINDFTNVHRTL